MTALVATQITNRLAAMAAAVTAANGYVSDVGATVGVARQKGMADQAPASFILPGRQKVSDYYGELEVEREYSIRAFADTRSHSAFDEHALVDQIIWDLRRRFGAEDEELSLLCSWLVGDDRPGYTEDGGVIVGADMTITTTYRVAASDPSTPL